MEKRVLIARWLGEGNDVIPIYDEASVSSARQRVREAGERTHLTTGLVESVALIASELTHNQLLYARQGYFAVKPVEGRGVPGLEVIAADIGPGIQRPADAFRDQVSTKGSLRAGLGVVLRQADEVEFDNRLVEGISIVARKFESQPDRQCRVAIMGQPYPGEAISGDDAGFFQTQSTFVAGVCDGLGHGPEARQASSRAVESLGRYRHLDLDQVLSRTNDELIGTRGCALCLIRFDRDSGIISCASIGDVHAHLYNLRDAHFFTSTPLVFGGPEFRRHRVRIENVTASPGSVLVMFTDGLKSRTSLKGQLDILRQPAIVIAQHLMENFSRPDDDALVLVASF
jgi:anti-sigma regulatory factor (Ser/Thr protein kinase)